MESLTLGFSRSVLLVDDHPKEREALKRYLDSEKFVIDTATDYQSATKALEAKTPSLVCVDLQLPRESGYELIEWVRGVKRLEWVPILVMSERGSPEDMAHAEHSGANAYIRKPFTKEKFLKYVATLLDGPHGSRPSVRRLRRNDPI